MKGFDKTSALSSHILTEKFVDLRLISSIISNLNKRILRSGVEFVLALSIMSSCFSAFHLLRSYTDSPYSRSVLVAALEEKGILDLNTSLYFENLIAPPLVSWKLLNSESGTAQSLENVERLRKTLEADCASCVPVSSRSSICRNFTMSSSLVDNVEVYFPDISSSLIPPIPYSSENRFVIPAANDSSFLYHLKYSGAACFSKLDIIFVSELDTSFFVDVVSADFVGDIHIRRSSIQALPGLELNSLGITTLCCVSGAFLSHVLLIWFGVRFSLLSLLFILSLGACTVFRLYIGCYSIFPNIVSQIRETSPSSPIYVNTIVYLMCWSQGAVFVQQIYVMTILMYPLRMFSFPRSFVIFLEVFAFLFISSAFIGSLAIGDTGISSVSSVWDFLHLQFQMISSQWPDTHFWDPARHSRPLVFSVWALMNGLVLFCVLYSFFQAVIGSQFSREMWITSGWATIREIGVFDTFKAGRKLANTKQARVTVTGLMKIVGPRLFEKLDNAGLISCIVPEPEKSIILQDDSFHENFGNMINQTIEVIRQLKTERFRSKQSNSKSETTVLTVSDETLKQAVENSFHFHASEP